MNERAECPAGVSGVPAEVLEDILDIDEAGRWAVLGDQSVTAPLPGRRLRAQTGANWIEDNVPGELHEMGFTLHEDGVKTALEKMAAETVNRIERLSVGAVEALHAGRKIRVRRFQDKVIVVGHQAESVTAPIHPVRDSG